MQKHYEKEKQKHKYKNESIQSTNQIGSDLRQKNKEFNKSEIGNASSIEDSKKD